MNKSYYRVSANPKKRSSAEMTYDLTVPDGNAYQICADPGPANKRQKLDKMPKTQGRLISHNTVSLLAGCNPGVHFPIANCYIRRVRISNDNKSLINILRDAGYKIEPCVGSEQTTSVVEFPIKLDHNIPTQDEVPVDFKFQLTSFLQKHWADNQVSCTIDFGQDEAPNLPSLLAKYQYELKSLSFLPRLESSMPYPQMPYEPITEERYNNIKKSIQGLDYKVTTHNIRASNDVEIEIDTHCDGDKCTS